MSSLLGFKHIKNKMYIVVILLVVLKLVAEIEGRTWADFVWE
jgi:hypothetical protein